MEHLNHLSLVDDNARFRRSLKDLDKIQSRQVLKAGIVYVAQGQEDQRGIFRNDSGSTEYNQFLKVTERFLFKVPGNWVGCGSCFSPWIFRRT
jgi:hypothetical protein